MGHRRVAVRTFQVLHAANLASRRIFVELRSNSFWAAQENSLREQIRHLTGIVGQHVRIETRIDAVDAWEFRREVGN